MKRRKNYMVVHRDPDVIWDKVEENWSKMVHLEPAAWLRTYDNMEAEEREDTATSSKRLAREGTS